MQGTGRFAAQQLHAGAQLLPLHQLGGAAGAPLRLYLVNNGLRRVHVAPVQHAPCERQCQRQRQRAQPGGHGQGQGPLPGAFGLVGAAGVVLRIAVGEQPAGAHQGRCGVEARRVFHRIGQKVESIKALHGELVLHQHLCRHQTLVGGQRRLQTAQVRQHRSGGGFGQAVPLPTQRHGGQWCQAGPQIRSLASAGAGGRSGQRVPAAQPLAHPLHRADVQQREDQRTVHHGRCVSRAGGRRITSQPGHLKLRQCVGTLFHERGHRQPHVARCVGVARRVRRARAGLADGARLPQAPGRGTQGLPCGRGAGRRSLACRCGLVGGRTHGACQCSGAWRRAGHDSPARSQRGFDACLDTQAACATRL